MYIQLLEDQCLHNIPYWKLLNKCLYVFAWSCRNLHGSGWGHKEEFDENLASSVTSYYPENGTWSALENPFWGKCGTNLTFQPNIAHVFPQRDMNKWNVSVAICNGSKQKASGEEGKHRCALDANIQHSSGVTPWLHPGYSHHWLREDQDNKLLLQESTNSVSHCSKLLLNNFSGLNIKTPSLSQAIYKICTQI